MSAPPDGRSEAFLSRWSRRKQAVPESRAAEDRRVSEEIAAERGLPPAPLAPSPQDMPADLPAIESLTSQSDFTRFMRPDVPLAARNAAVKKLFTDPHFNVMDGLDIYIDDYSKPDPIPPAMLRDLAQSRMLGLFDHEDEKAIEGEADPHALGSREATASALDAVLTDAGRETTMIADPDADPGPVASPPGGGKPAG
jgi:hypothetical protein